MIPPLRLGDDVLELILANVRTPDIRRGDLRAQTAANRRRGPAAVLRSVPCAPPRPACTDGSPRPCHWPGCSAEEGLTYGLLLNAVGLRLVCVTGSLPSTIEST